ncbi:hypothetical protein HID58_075448, partial [Brassica napus]
SALPTQPLKLSDLVELLNSMLNSVNLGFNHYRPYLRDGSIVKKAHGEHESVKDLKAMEARYLSYRPGFVENQCILMTAAGTSEMRNCQNDSHEHDLHQFT